MDIYKAKYDTPCDKCKKKILTGRLFFIDNKIVYCVKCIQAFIDVELEKLLNRKLDLLNIQGKAYMMEKEYEKKDRAMQGMQPEIKVSDKS